MIENEFSNLFSPHIKVLYRVAYQWTLDPGEAEELVQELASKLIERTAELKKIQQLKPWLIKVMYRLFVDLYRRKKLSPVVFEHTLAESQRCNESFATKECEPESVANLLELRTSLEIALKKLDPNQASAIFLFEVEGFSIREIAALQKVSEGTVKSRLFRARAALQKLISLGTFTDLRSCIEERKWK